MNKLAPAALTFLVIHLSAFAGPPTRPASPAEGDKAPDFSLKTPDRQVVTLSEELKTRTVALIVLRGWPGYQCPLCTKQVADLRAHAAEIEKARLTVILVYPGPANGLKDHATEFVGATPLPANWRFVIDPEYEFTHAWGLRWLKKGETAYPSTFLIDQDQVVRFAHVSTAHGDRVDARTLLDHVPR